EDSPLGLDKWLPAVWLIANSKNGISSHELARSIGVTQKSTWFMLHRIRLAMQTGSFDKLSGTVEVDEDYIGGKARNMSAERKSRKPKGRGHTGETAVVGMIERGGEVRASVVEDTKKRTLIPLVKENVQSGASVYTDLNRSYVGLDWKYDHQTV